MPTPPPSQPAAEQLASGIVWEEPPAQTKPGRQPLPWASWARMLKRHPMRWGKLHTFDKPTTARNAAASKFRREHMPKDQFEVRAGLIGEDGTSSALWGRYIGAEDD